MGIPPTTTKTSKTKTTNDNDNEDNNNNNLWLPSMGTDMINDNTIINKYYTTEQRKYIYKFLKRLASDDTWDSLKVYFPDDDDNNNIDVVNNDNNKEEQDNNNNIPSTSTFDDKY